MQVKHKTKKIAPEAQKTSWKRPDVCEQLASQKQDLDSDDRPGLIHHHNISMDKKSLYWIPIS